MSIAEVTRFWLDEVGPKGWYGGGAALDAEVRHRFGGLWQEARDGGLRDWAATPEGALALILLTDQFPRNMFRDEARSFATDALAVTLADAAIAAGHDMATPVPARQFFYLPFMHAEDLALQSRCIDLFVARMPGDNVRHARAHATAIARFGRFPWRNAALGRLSTPEEASLLAAGGYGQLLRETPAIAAS